MIDPLLALPAHLRERLARALDSGQVEPPYGRGSVRAALNSSEQIEAICAALTRLGERGVPGPAIALALDVAGRVAARLDRPQLVWSGPEVPGLHARDTRRVYEELVAAAQRSIWLSSYVVWEGEQAFKTLAERLDSVPTLQVTLLLNIGRKRGNTTAPGELVRRFTERFWSSEWPGKRRPSVFYDPRSVDLGGGGVLHAKAVVVDDATAFVTSANLTEAAFDRNIEAGVLSRDPALAASLARHFRVLIDQKLLQPLPT